MISEGDQVPAITMKLSDGTSLDLARPGGLLLLYFYLRTIRRAVPARPRNSQPAPLISPPPARRSSASRAMR